MFAKCSSSHQIAVLKLRKKFGQEMKDMGTYREQGKLQITPGRSHEEDVEKRWEWLTFRKVKAREFNHHQIT